MAHLATTSTLPEADHAAEKLLAYLAPVCLRVEVAGSVRRRQASIGDIEIVAIPRVRTLFEAEDINDAGGVDLLQRLTDQAAAGELPDLRRAEPNAELPRPAGKKPRRFAWGPKWKRLVVLDRDRWHAVDLFITTRAQWGSILAIRTGPKEFSQLLVTPRAQGGAMPAEHRQHEGFLEHRQDGEWQQIYTPEEADYFAALGLPVWEPNIRSERRIRDELCKQGTRR